MEKKNEEKPDKNTAAEVIQSDVYESLEFFPAWIESRKLFNVIKGSRIKGEDETERFFRNSTSSRAELIFFNAAEAYERIKADRAAHGLDNALEEISRMKSSVYMLFDQSKISREAFSAILLQANRVHKEFEALAAEEKRQRETRRSAMRDMDGEDYMPPSANRRPQARNPRRKPDDDNSER